MESQGDVFQGSECFQSLAPILECCVGYFRTTFEVSIKLYLAKKNSRAEVNINFLQIGESFQGFTYFLDANVCYLRTTGKMSTKFNDFSLL